MQTGARHADPRALLRSRKNEVFHFAAAEIFRFAFAQKPADGINNIRFSRAVRPHDRDNARRKFQNRLIGKRFKTVQFELFRKWAMTGRDDLLCSCNSSERVLRGLDLGVLLRKSLALRDELVAEINAHREAALMRRAGLAPHGIRRRHFQFFLDDLLKLALRILIAFRFQNFIKMDKHEFLHECARLLETLVEIDRADHGLDRVRQNDLPRAAGILPLAAGH